MRPRATSYQSWLTITTKYDRYTALLRSFEKRIRFFRRAGKGLVSHFLGGLAGHFSPAGRKLRTTGREDRACHSASGGRGHWEVWWDAGWAGCLPAIMVKGAVIGNELYPYDTRRTRSEEHYDIVQMNFAHLWENVTFKWRYQVPSLKDGWHHQVHSRKAGFRH